MNGSNSINETHQQLQNRHINSLSTTVITPDNEGNENKQTEEATCGWWVLKPKCLQTKQTAKWVLFCLCWAGAVQGMVVNGFVNVCITTIEKRFNLKSADTGLIAGAYDIASVLCSVPVSYLGSLPGASKPRWIGCGLLIMGLGSFIFAIPHFASPLYKDVSLQLDSGSDYLLLCSSKPNESSCQVNSDMWISSFRFMFAFGQFLHGVGASPLYTLGITFLDESVSVRSSSLYLGVFYAMAIVGPAFGYVLGGQLLNIYIDSPSITSSQLSLNPSSDQWLGAWWIGFLISGCLSIFIGITIAAFPKEIPGSKAREIQRKNEANSSSVKMRGNPHSFKDLSDLPKASKTLVTNLTFVFLSLAGASEGILLTGFATFMSKFIESQFSIPASSAALLVGIVAVPAGGGGTLLGGWFIKYFSLKSSGVLKLCASLSLLCFFACFSFVISCPNNNFAGITVGYFNSSSVPSKPSLNSPCNYDCGCDDISFNPVCGTDYILYFSPCHAGCKSVSIVNGTKIFGNCECVNDSLQVEILDRSTWPNSLEESSALLQKCPSMCPWMGIFLTIFFLIMSLTFVISLPAVSATLRCVPDAYRSLALGVQWIIVRLLGTIPGPILFGLVIDSTCIFWQQTCDVDGACRSYDNYMMSRSMMAISLVFKCLSTLFFFLSWWYYGPRKKPQSITEVSLDNTISTISTISARENPAFDQS